jgi:nitrite reductase/ring-hydroxylating ferredoxin subunit
MDEELVVFRTRSGALRASRPWCPHLGAHLGHGGRVEGETLRCPFHGFRFDADGACVATPYGRPPRGARLALVPVREVCGVVMAFHGPPGGPSWEIEPVDDASGWRPPRTRRLRFPGHPQEVTENSVDLGHLAVLHRFRDVRMIEPLTTDGPRLRVSYAFTRPFVAGWGPRARIRIRVDGLGFSLVELDVQGGWSIRQLVLTTPTAPREVVAHVATALRRKDGGRTPRPLLGPVEAMVEHGILQVVLAELRRDMPMWRHKKYLEHPALTAGDGPIGRYRAWARQFYPEGNPR